ncbi:hypothetical protein WG915_02185 [Corynebacterium sp. H128]|uniref:hypothetical protein n=1 Tax=unclassified Corynebacterium TaxID=2624378 RepID=UPI0030979AF6
MSTAVLHKSNTTIDTNHLSFALCRTEEVDAALSDSAFAESPATVALSAEIRVGFRDPHANSETLLSHRALSDLGFTALKAWDCVAKGVIHRATELGAARFFVRSINATGTAIQIRPSVGDDSTWLAHPELFSRLLGCARQYLNTTCIHFYYCGPHFLIAVNSALSDADLPALPGAVGPLMYHEGFPELISTR